MNQRTNLPTARAMSLRSLARGGVMLLLALLAGACSREDDPNLQDDEALVPLQVKASIGAELAKPVTKAGGYETSDMMVYKETEPNRSHYIYDNGDGNGWRYLSNNSILYIGAKEEKVYAVAGVDMNNNITTNVPILTLNPEGYIYTSSDYQESKSGAWYGMTTASKSNPEANFGELKPAATTFAFNISNVTPIPMTLTGIRFESKLPNIIYVYSYINMDDDSRKNNETRLTLTPLSFPSQTISSGSSNKIWWVLPSIRVESGLISLVLTVNGQELSVDIPVLNESCEPGNRCTLNLVLRGTELTLASPVKVEKYGEYQDVAIGGPESYGIQLKPEQMFTTAEVPACTDEVKQQLSQLRWAEENLLLGTSTDITYCGIPPYDKGYLYEQNIITGGTDPCSKLDASMYGTDWRMPTGTELDLLSRCCKNEIVYKKDIYGDGSKWRGSEFMQSGIGVFFPFEGAETSSIETIHYIRYLTDSDPLLQITWDENGTSFSTYILIDGTTSTQVKGAIRCVKGPKQTGVYP